MDDVAAVLADGSRQRSTAATAMNSSSSRSHAILSVKICADVATGACSLLHLVDLAGVVFHLSCLHARSLIDRVRHRRGGEPEGAQTHPRLLWDGNVSGSSIDLSGGFSKYFLREYMQTTLACSIVLFCNW